MTYNSSIQVEQVSGIPDYQDIYGQGSNQNYNGGFIGNWGAPFPGYVDQLNARYGTQYSKVYAPGYPEGTVPHPLVSTGFALGEGYDKIFTNLLDANGKPVAVPYRPYDIIGGFFETGNMWENSLNISAGGQDASLSAVVSRMTNEGIVPESRAARTSLSFGGNGKLTNGLILSGK